MPKATGSKAVATKAARAKTAKQQSKGRSASNPKAARMKPRILYLYRILAEETDPEHGLSLPQIQEKLAVCGISCERKALYRDFDALDAAGVKIGKLHTRPVAYFLESRPFDPTQMMLLADAVQTSRSITKSNSAALIRRLKKLASKNQAKSIDARVHVSGRVKMQNESIFRTLDLVQRAIAEKRDISFAYMRYDVNKKLHDVPSHDGMDRVKTPLYLVYSNDNYYMLAYDEDAADHIRVYRADRMRNILVLGKSDKAHRLDPGFDIAAYEKQSVDMYGGRPQLMKLHVAEELVGNVIDMFGTDDVECAEAKGVRELAACNGDGKAGKSPKRKWAVMRVKAAPSATFFGRIAQFGGDVRIVHPRSAVEAYERHLEKTLAAQRL